MAGLSAQEELVLLRKRARRRLVGAVFLVLVSTAVLWRVVGRVEELPMKPESVLVVGESASAPAAKASSSPAVLAVAPVEASKPDATALPESLSSVAAPAPVEASSAPERAPAPTPVVQPKPAATEHPVAKPRKKAVDPAAILEGRADNTVNSQDARTVATGGKVVIQLAALSDPDKADALRGKLGTMGVEARFSKVETSKGAATRVRVGPFAREADAQAVLKKLARAGVSGIIITLSKS